MKTKIHSTATRFLKSGLALLTATAISLSAINHRDVLAAYLINTLQSTESPTTLEDDLAGHWTFDGPDITGSTTSGSSTNTGWLTASTGANMTGVGTSAWSNPTNGTTSNNSYATVAGSGTSGWFNENYTKRKKLTIDETKVGGSSNLTNYPVLVSMTDTDLRTTANGGDVTSASGYDIIFTDGTNSTQLAHEIESYNASTGAINMWVTIPTLSVSADTDFYIYYGNSGISTSQEDEATVWDAYEAVWHLNDAFTDSANSHDGTDYNTTSSTGVVGNGRLCDHSPTTRYFSVPDDGSTLDFGTNFTASIWVRPTEAFINWDKIMTKGMEGTSNMSYVINVATAVNDEPSVNFYNTAGGNGNARSTVAMNPNGSTWYHIASVKTGTDVSVFTNGTETESYSQAFSGTPRDGDGDLYICANVNGWGSRFQGDVDEVRIAKTNLSSGWIATEHSTITNKGVGTGKFIKTVASEETQTAGSVTSNYLRASNFGMSIPTDATIDGVEVRFERKTAATTNTNIVRLINASGAVAGNDKSTDPSWSGSDTFETYGGTSDLWGLSLAPADVNDTDFGFVVSAIHQGSAAENASIDSMQVRIHYTTAGASNLSALDVSGGGNNGDIISGTVIEGGMGQALDFNGTSDYVDIGATGQTVNSVSFWLKADDTTTRNILGLNGTANINLNSSSIVTATGFTSPTIYVDGVVASTIPNNDWHHVVVTTGTGISASDMDIGRFSTGYFDGMLDDVRIYSRALTGNEIMRLYAMGESKTNASSVDRHTDGLIGHWTMDGNNIDWSNSTAEIQDSSIEGNDGNAYSMSAADSVQPGILGQALQFDGTDDLIDIPNTSDLKPSNDISISFWAKLDQTASALGHNQVLLYKGHSSAPWYSYIVQQFSSNNKLAFQWVNSSGTDYYAETNTTLSAGIWYHIVAVKRNGQTHQIYINGVDETGWSATSSGTIFNSSNGLVIGSNWGNDDVDGMMDDVRIYNRALSADEVIGLYAMGETIIGDSKSERVSDGLIGHWTMDGADISGTSQSGTATDTGLITAGTGSNNTAVGTAAWTNPTNGTTSNNSYATVAGSGTADWFDANYGKRKKLTIDETKVGGASNLTDYPILVSMTDTDLRTTANGGDVTNANGYDIIFTDGTNSTQLAHEIESYNASTGAIEMWVSIPTLSVSADTDFYIYYGNSSVSTSQEDEATVWDAYEGVWHLNNEFTDSANSHDGTNSGSVDDAGVVGRGRDFSDDSISVPDGGNNSLDVSTNMTVSTWIKPDTAYGNYAKFLTKGADGSNIGWSMDVNTGSSNRVQANFYNTTPTYQTVVSNTTMSTAGNTWYHVTGVKTGADLSFFVNGVENENWSGGFSGTPRDVSGNLYIGASAGGGANRVSGDMDEVRIAKTNLSAGWLLTEYNTITLKGTGAGKFIKTVASEESSGSGSVTTNYLRASNFGFNIPSTATIDGIEVGFERKTDGSSTTTSSVRLVNAAGTIAGNDKSTGTGWTASDVWENHGGSSDLWGLTLTPTDINDTDFGFVVSAAHTGTSAQNASIDSLRVKVYYTTAGTNDLSAVDRTANTNDGDITGATPDFGTLGQAMDFDGSDDLISIPDNATLDFGASENFSVSTWVKTTQAVVADTWPIIVNKESGSSPRQGYGLTLHDSNWNANWYFEIWVGGTKYQCFGDSNIADGDWHHLVGIRNGSNLEVYEDGALADTCAGSTSSVANSRPFNFGGISGGSWSFFDGNIDDIRLYNRALTADEVYDLYQVGAP